MSRYTRKQVSELVGFSANTIWRWEKTGKTPPPKKVSHSKQCIYTDDIVSAIKAFIVKEEEPDQLKGQ